MKNKKEKAGYIRDKMWRVLKSCRTNSPLCWNIDNEAHLDDRHKIAEKYLLLAVARIKEIEDRK